MLKDLVMLATCSTASYAWLSAIVSPIVRAGRAAIRQRGSRVSLAMLALAAAAAVLWTIVPAGFTLLGMMLEPRAGLELLQTQWLAPGLAERMPEWRLRTEPRKQAIPMVAPLDEGFGWQDLGPGEDAFLPFLDQF